MEYVLSPDKYNAYFRGRYVLFMLGPTYSASAEIVSGQSNTAEGTKSAKTTSNLVSETTLALQSP